MHGLSPCRLQERPWEQGCYTTNAIYSKYTISNLLFARGNCVPAVKLCFHVILFQGTTWHNCQWTVPQICKCSTEGCPVNRLEPVWVISDVANWRLELPVSVKIYKMYLNIQQAMLLYNITWNYVVAARVDWKVLGWLQYGRYDISFISLYRHDAKKWVSPLPADVPNPFVPSMIKYLEELDQEFSKHFAWLITTIDTLKQILCEGQ